MKNRYFKFKNILITNYGDYILKSVSNLETGSANRRKINYIDTDGTSWTDIWYHERAFEISGIIQAYDSNTMVKLKRRLISCCDLKQPFVLEYFNREGKYRAECYFDKLPTFLARQNWFLEFKLYITIPSFYWESAQIHTVKLFSYQDEIVDEFELPCVFTTRISKITIPNNGDTMTYPIFIVRYENMSDSSITKITNHSTNEKLILNYVIAENETIEIDTAKRTVTSNINGNITNYLDISSDFPTLQKGQNKFEALSLGSNVTIRFRERYLGV